MRNVELKVEGMHCQHCVAATKAALEAVPGVRNVEVSLEDGTVALEAGAIASDEKLVAAIGRAGFGAVVV